MFADPAAVLGEFRKCVLGFDGNCGGYAMRSLPRWNVDLGVHKTVAMFREGMGADFSVQFTNVINHVVMGNPAMSLTTPSQFGRITSRPALRATWSSACGSTSRIGQDSSSAPLCAPPGEGESCSLP
jgi:hypothetical protein